MVWKIGKLVCVLGLIGAILCAPVQAATHEIYPSGNLGTTYITYFKDIISGVKFNDDYVAFRTDQNVYNMVVGDLEYKDGEIYSVSNCKEYIFFQDDSLGYSSQYRYIVNEIPEFSVYTSDYILYSNVGDFPQLIERGAKYEIFTAILLVVALLCIVVGRFFRRR